MVVILPKLGKYDCFSASMYDSIDKRVLLKVFVTAVKLHFLCCRICFEISRVSSWPLSPKGGLHHRDLRGTQRTCEHPLSEAIYMYSVHMYMYKR